MKRYALIIEASEAKGQAKLPGCARDAERLSRWLSNNAGGAWESVEVTVLRNPSRTEVNRAMQQANLADFTLVHFSGHGEILEDYYTGRRDQRIVLGTGEEMNFDDLKPVTPRSIMICDACREISRSVRFSTRTKAMHETFAEDVSRDAYRTRFDEIVSSVPEGMFRIYSCSPGESAGEDPLNGGYFTDALITLSGEWRQTRSWDSILTIDAAFAAAKSFVEVNYRDQRPVGGPSNRKGNPFPFGLRLTPSQSQWRRQW